MLPFTVKVNPVPPAVAEPGLRLVIVGTGLLIVKVCGLDVPPPGTGLSTVTDCAPAVAISEAEIEAVN